MNNINNVDNSMNNENLNNVIDHTNSIDRVDQECTTEPECFQLMFIRIILRWWHYPSLQLSGNFNGVGGRSSVVTIGDKINDNGMSGIKADLVKISKITTTVDRHDVNDPATDVINNGIHKIYARTTPTMRMLIIKMLCKFK